MNFAKIVDGVPVRARLKLPAVIPNGEFNAILTRRSKMESFIALGYFPIIGTLPIINRQLRRVGAPELVENGDQVDEIWPVVDKPIDEGRQILKDEIVRLMIANQDGGITLDGLPVCTDSGAIADMTAAKLEARTMDQVIVPRRGGGVKIIASKAKIDTIFTKVSDYRRAVMTRAGALIDDVDAANTVADLSGIDIEGQWPTSELTT